MVRIFKSPYLRKSWQPVSSELGGFGCRPRVLALGERVGQDQGGAGKV